MKNPAWISHLSLPAVNLFEVGPRDGLQNESRILSVEERVELIAKLVATGLRDIEIGSFVRADRIPALANTAEVIKGVRERKLTQASAVRFWAFVPNERGLVDAQAAGIDGVAFFITTSETFCQKNVNRSLAQQKKEVASLLKLAERAKLPSRVYLSTMVYCPYEGVIAPEVTAKLAAELVDMGATRVALSDTTGHATPLSLAAVLELCLKQNPTDKFSLHLHDTRGLALANALEGLRAGISEFDAAIAGLGGCPYAPGASGNLATEDLAYLLSEMKLLRGVDLAKVAKAGFYVEACLNKRGPSKVLRTFQE